MAGGADLRKQQAALNSESPGLIIDRLSILALKIYHTRKNGAQGSPEGHAQRNTERLEVLREQRADLAACRITVAGHRDWGALL